MVLRCAPLKTAEKEEEIFAFDCDQIMYAALRAFIKKMYAEAAKDCPTSIAAFSTRLINKKNKCVTLER